MERKSFLVAAAGLAGAAAAGGPAEAMDPVMPLRFEDHSDRNMVLMSKIIDAVATDLRQDAHDYGGFREKAVDQLSAAITSIARAIQFEESHRG